MVPMLYVFPAFHVTKSSLTPPTVIAESCCVGVAGVIVNTGFSLSYPLIRYFPPFNFSIIIPLNVGVSCTLLVFKNMS